MSCRDNQNKEKKYENVRISDITRSGMTLTIDDMKYLQRMLSLQDDCFEVQLEEMEKRITNSLATVLVDFNKNILAKLDEIQKDIKEIKTEISEIKVDIVDIYREINLLQKRVSKLEKEIIVLEKKVDK